jgi:SPP1 gp7 family putative phage head morphogenesis protein
MTLVDTHGNPIKSPSLNTSIAALPGQGMTSSTFLGPNAPIYPADGVSRFPRGFEFPAGYNISARPRSRSRMSFYAMKMLIDNYDIAQIAIRHLQNSLSSYEFALVPIEGWDGDVTREVAYAKSILRKPDGVNYFRPWLRKYLKSILRYDAGTLYRMRLNSGRAYGLKVINGETIAPLIDGWGDRPTGDAPAYVQFINGMTWNWLLDSDLIYQPMHPDDDSPYGSPAIEGIVTAANTDLRLQLFLMQTFTEGNIPAGFGMAPDTWSPDQILDFQQAFDAFTTGSPEAKTQIRFIPGGMALQFPALSSFDAANAEEAKWLMQKTAAMFSVTPDDLGFTQNSNRSVGESQADVSQKVGDVPLAHHIDEILSGFMQDDLGLPLEFQFDLGGEEEDRLATSKSDEVYIKNGVVSSSEIRELRFGKTDNMGEIVPRFIFTPAGGAMPVSALLAASPQVDPENALPLEGVIPPATPQVAQPAALTSLSGASVAKSESVGVTADTGYTGNPLKSGEDDEDEELAKFAKFRKSRLRLGKWWDFTFEHVDPEMGRQLNAAGRAKLSKAVPEDDAAFLAEPLTKSWRDGAPKTPQHQYDLVITDYYSPAIATALENMVDAVPLASIIDSVSGLLVKSAETDALAQAVRAKLSGTQLSTDALEQIIRQVIVDGYLAGGHAGMLQVGAHAVTLSGAMGAAEVNTDWGSWVPGNTAAALKDADGGLRALLDGSNITVKGIAQTTLDQIGNKIASGLAAGDPSDKIGRDIRSDVGAKFRADMIAHTETARAVTSATFDVYQANDIEEWDLLDSSDTNDECADIAAAGPYPAGDMTNAPPIHPMCRCSSAPHVGKSS